MPKCLFKTKVSLSNQPADDHSGKAQSVGDHPCILMPKGNRENTDPAKDGKLGMFRAIKGVREWYL